MDLSKILSGLVPAASSDGSSSSNGFFGQIGNAVSSMFAKPTVPSGGPASPAANPQLVTYALYAAGAGAIIWLGSEIFAMKPVRRRRRR